MAEETFSGFPASGAGKGSFSPLSLPGGPDPVRPVSGAWWKAGRLSGHPRDNDAEGDFPARPGAPTKTFFGIPRGGGIPATLLSPASGRRSVSPARVESAAWPGLYSRRANSSQCPCGFDNFGHARASCQSGFWPLEKCRYIGLFLQCRII